MYQITCRNFSIPSTADTVIIASFKNMTEIQLSLPLVKKSFNFMFLLCWKYRINVTRVSRRRPVFHREPRK